MQYNKPLPQIDGINKPFWDAARRNTLVVQVCESCGHKHFPPTPSCPRCLSKSQTWQAVSGRGTLESWIDFHHAYWAGFKDELPYRVCVVRLEEGPLLVSNLLEDSGTPKLGAPVHVVFENVTEEITLAKFAID